MRGGRQKRGNKKKQTSSAAAAAAACRVSLWNLGRRRRLSRETEADFASSLSSDDARCRYLLYGIRARGSWCKPGGRRVEVELKACCVGCVRRVFTHTDVLCAYCALGLPPAWRLIWFARYLCVRLNNWKRSHAVGKRRIDTTTYRFPYIRRQSVTTHVEDGIYRALRAVYLVYGYSWGAGFDSRWRPVNARGSPSPLSSRGRQIGKPVSTEVDGSALSTRIWSLHVSTVAYTSIRLINDS